MYHLKSELPNRLNERATATSSYIFRAGGRYKCKGHKHRRAKVAFVRVQSFSSVFCSLWQDPILAKDRQRRRINQKLRRDSSPRAADASIRTLLRVPFERDSSYDDCPWENQAKSINQFPSTSMHDAALVCVWPHHPPSLSILLATNRTHTRRRRRILARRATKEKLF